MRDSRARGVALIFTLGIILLVSVVIATLLLNLKFQIGRQEIWLDRVKAYYLCQTGLSVAMLDLSKGKVPTLPAGQSYSKTFSFPMGSKSYNITYTITMQSNGNRTFRASVLSPFGLGYTYRLDSRGRRPWPLFIRGKP
jgi:hypothetical protein